MSDAEQDANRHPGGQPTHLEMLRIVREKKVQRFERSSNPERVSNKERERLIDPREWWRGLDSNQRTHTRADLQSAAFNHSATSPRPLESEAAR